MSTHPHQAVTSLDRAPRAEWVQVLDIPRAGRAHRFLGQVGVLLNERLRVLSIAPLGGPVLVDAGGATIAIGRSLARQITVRVMGLAHRAEVP